MSRFDGSYIDDDDDMDDDDDDDDLFDDEGDFEELGPEEIEAAKYNELVIRQISDELCDMSNREFVAFLSEELDSLGFSDSSELILVGLEFSNGQYVIQFYNIREDQSVKSATGAGNLRMLVDGWVMKTVTDLQILKLYGELADELRPSDLTDCYMNLLLDIIDWKQTRSSGETSDPEDGGDPEDDQMEHCG
jgi:hypothetical protein